MKRIEKWFNTFVKYIAVKQKLFSTKLRTHDVFKQRYILTILLAFLLSTILGCQKNKEPSVTPSLLDYEVIREVVRYKHKVYEEKPDLRPLLLFVVTPSIDCGNGTLENCEEFVFSKSFFPFSFHTISQQALLDLMETPQNRYSWEPIYEKFDTYEIEIFHFSLVKLEDENHASIFCSSMDGGLSGKCGKYFLEKTDQGWKVTGKEIYWVS